MQLCLLLLYLSISNHGDRKNRGDFCHTKSPFLPSRNALSLWEKAVFEPSSIRFAMSEHSDSEVDEIDPSEKWTPEEREQYFNEMEECPLLMKDYTEV